MTAIRGRYAPSPTGDLHRGNLRTALLAWLAARKLEGTFILRIEDLDLPRTRPGATERIIDDLRWLGLAWDEGPDCGGPYGPYHQSSRQAIYEAALADLRAANLLYPCYCTRAELARAIASPGNAPDEPRYPGTCHHLTEKQRRAYEESGRRPAWRFHVPEGVVRFADGVAGPQAQDVARAVGDFIVRRSDGIIAYQLAVVVDDGLMSITQVVRGADLLDSTARQIILFRALGYSIPTYTHVPLMADAAGAKLSKRERAEGLGPARAAGIAPEVVVGQLAASAGIWPAGTPISPRELLDIDRENDVMPLKPL
ncbi:MAG TPA: tRNA glutamyl-Q(34) synthetase GluQRS [Ktedonobacterales bacterium]|nr:tRNA glutamyl-Q(34) synthetase GluQRS [Ktedonobacterales bacterium]